MHWIQSSNSITPSRLLYRCTSELKVALLTFTPTINRAQYITCITRRIAVYLETHCSIGSKRALPPAGDTIVYLFTDGKAVQFLHSTIPSVTCLRLSDASVICRVTYFHFPIQSAFLQYIAHQAVLFWFYVCLRSVFVFLSVYYGICWHGAAEINLIDLSILVYRAYHHFGIGLHASI